MPKVVTPLLRGEDPNEGEYKRLISYQNDDEEEIQYSLPRASAMQVRIRLDQQVRQIASVRSDFDEAIQPARRLARFYMLGAAVSLISAVCTWYVFGNSTDSTIKQVFLGLAILSTMSTVVTGGMSCGWCCWKSGDGGDFGRAIQQRPNFEERKTAALGAVSVVGIKVEDGAAPFVLNDALTEAEQRSNKAVADHKRRSAQRLAFFSGNHPRLGKHSTTRTFFNGLDSGGRGKARDVICDDIFKFAGMNP